MEYPAYTCLLFLRTLLHLAPFHLRVWPWWRPVVPSIILPIGPADFLPRHIQKAAKMGSKSGTGKDDGNLLQAPWRRPKMHAMFIRFSHRHPVSTLGREEYLEPPPVFCSLSSSFWSVADPLALQQVADGIPRSLSPWLELQLRSSSPAEPALLKPAVNQHSHT